MLSIFFKSSDSEVNQLLRAQRCTRYLYCYGCKSRRFFSFCDFATGSLKEFTIAVIRSDRLYLLWCLHFTYLWTGKSGYVNGHRHRRWTKNNVCLRSGKFSVSEVLSLWRSQFYQHPEQKYLRKRDCTSINNGSSGRDVRTPNKNCCGKDLKIKMICKIFKNWNNNVSYRTCNSKKFLRRTH